MAKKNNNANSQKKLKLVRAQYRNEFFEKFKHILNTVCGENLFQNIPASSFDYIYKIRSHSLRPVAASGHKFPVYLIDRFKRVLSRILKDTPIVIDDNGFEISLYDFITVAFSIIKFSYMTNDHDFEGAEKIRTKFSQLLRSETIDNSVRQKLANILYSLSAIQNDIGKCLYWFNYESSGIADPSGPVHHIAYLHKYEPKSISIQINGNARPVMPLEWSQTQIGLVPMTVKPSLFNIDSPFAEIPIKIYIQNHALQRLAERIDNLDLGLVHLFVYFSFRDIKVFYDINNNLLIEYRIENSRAGYFRADLIDGMLIVRTFLFITNNSTPEGQLLEKNTGLQKLDKKHLAIDKLSTFMTSGIRDNDVLRKIFNESGCHSLFDIYEKVDEYSTKHSNQFTAELMINYLSYNMSD